MKKSGKLFDRSLESYTGVECECIGVVRVGAGVEKEIVCTGMDDVRSSERHKIGFDGRGCDIDID